MSKCTSKYRIKTKQEFIDDKCWNFENNLPIDWNNYMFSLIGTDIPSIHNSQCDNNEDLIIYKNKFSFFIKNIYYRKITKDIYKIH